MDFFWSRRPPVGNLFPSRKLILPSRIGFFSDRDNSRWRPFSKSKIDFTLEKQILIQTTFWWTSFFKSKKNRFYTWKPDFFLIHTTSSWRLFLSQSLILLLRNWFFSDRDNLPLETFVQVKNRFFSREIDFFLIQTTSCWKPFSK